MQCCLGAFDTDDEDGTGGRRFDLPSRPLVIAFDWLGIEHRCAAACVSKHWSEASAAAPLWAHWFLHMKDHWMKYDQDIWDHEPPHHQRSNAIAFTDLPRLSPMLVARLQKHATCLVLHLHADAFVTDRQCVLTPVTRAWDTFATMAFPRLGRVELYFNVHWPQVVFDFDDGTLPAPQSSVVPFRAARSFAPLLAATTVIVDDLHGLGQKTMIRGDDVVVMPYHLSLERVLGMFKSLQHFSMMSTFGTPIGPDAKSSLVERYPESETPQDVLAHLSQGAGVDLFELRSLGWIFWDVLKVQMQQPRSMRNLVSLGVEGYVLNCESLTELFVSLSRFAPSLEFLAVSAGDGFEWLWGPEFEDVPATLSDLVLSFDPGRFELLMAGFSIPDDICNNLLDSITVHIASPGDPPRGPTWPKDRSEIRRGEYYNRDRPTPPGGFKSIYNGDGSLRRVYPHWSQMPWCVDIHERLIPPDRYHSYRGRLSADALAERRREREEEDY